MKSTNQSKDCMTQKEYALYLGQLIDMEVDAESDFLEEQFFGYFQAFMPYGDNLEKVFEPLEQGKELYQRIKPIFKTTESRFLEAQTENCVPAYFIPPKNGSTEELYTLAKELLAGFIKFAKFIKVKKLQKLLSQVTEIEISQNEEQNFDDELHNELYEVLSIWRIESTDYDSLNALLTEAYYSIGNDYFLSAYLQYPTLTEKPKSDFLKPYFEIWLRGYHFVFNGNKLILF